MAQGSLRVRGGAGPKPPKPPDLNKVVSAPPRIKPASTRNYGKGGTPLSGMPDQGVRGGGIGYGGGLDMLLRGG